MGCKVGFDANSLRYVLYGHHNRSPHRQDRRTPGQGGSSTPQNAGRKSLYRGPASSRASAALGAPPQRISLVRAPGDSPVRTQAPQAGSSNRQERTTQTVQPLPRRYRPTVTVSGPTYRGPPSPPVALSQVLDRNSEELVYHTSEYGLEH